MSKLVFTFGEMEARLARVHDIADAKRTAFQARLKNFHRLGFPADLKSTKGKTSLYSPALVMETALAIELTELGIPPDRAVDILKSSVLPVSLALKSAAAVLGDQVRNRPPSRAGPDLRATYGMGTFLTLDPAALWPLSRDAETSLGTWDIARLTLFCLRDTAVKRELISLTTYSNRLSILNVTSLLTTIAQPTDNVSIEDRLRWLDDFFSDVESFAAGRADLKSDFAGVRMLERYLTMRGVSRHAAEDPSLARQIAHDTYLPTATARKAIKQYLSGRVP